MYVDSVHQALGSRSARVKQFIVQRSEDDIDLDDVQVALSRVTANEIAAICTRLARMAGVRACMSAPPVKSSRSP